MTRYTPEENDKYHVTIENANSDSQKLNENSSEPDITTILNALEDPNLEAKADSFVKLKQLLPSLEIIGYRVSLQKMTINYIEMLSDLEKNDQGKYCLKIFTPESAFLMIRTGWHPSFSLITEKMYSLTLVKLNVVFIQGNADKEEKQMQNLADIISSIKSLECLKILITAGLLSIKGIISIGEALKKLERLSVLHLTFKYCSNIADQEVKQLAEMINELPKLKHFTIEFLGCIHVTRNGVTRLVEKELVALQPIQLVLPES